jgi:hypothetical protein
MAGGVRSSIQDFRRRVLVRHRKRILARNEAQLNCVSLRSRFDYVARRGLSRVEMNAQKTGAFGSPLRAKRKTVVISCLTTPTLLSPGCYGKCRAALCSGDLVGRTQLGRISGPGFHCFHVQALWCSIWIIDAELRLGRVSDAHFSYVTETVTLQHELQSIEVVCELMFKVLAEY